MSSDSLSRPNLHKFLMSPAFLIGQSRFVFKLVGSEDSTDIHNHYVGICGRCSMYTWFHRMSDQIYFYHCTYVVIDGKTLIDGVFQQLIITS